MAFNHNHLSDHQDLPLHHQQQHQQQQASQLQENNGPNWLNTALLRSQQPQPPQQHCHFSSDPNFLNLHAHNTHAATTASDSPTAPNNQWLSRSSSSLLHRNRSDVMDDVGASAEAVAMESGDFKNSSCNDILNKSEGGVVESGGGVVNWQNARYKADILAHPLCEQLLSAHVACLG